MEFSKEGKLCIASGIRHRLITAVTLVDAPQLQSVDGGSSLSA
jgi:hypothetical protein